jgi:hypothetical protein
MIIIIMRGENFVAHLDGLGGTLVCRRTPVAHHWYRELNSINELMNLEYGLHSFYSYNIVRMMRWERHVA